MRRLAHGGTRLLALVLGGLLAVACSAGQPPEISEASSSRTPIQAPTTDNPVPRTVPTLTAFVTPSTTRAQPSRTASATSHSPTPLPTSTLVPATSTPPPTETATPTQLPTATPDPFAPYFIETLAARSYGEGLITVGPLLRETERYWQYEFSYPSDGLRVTGYLNLPRGTGPFPVVLLNHGYYFLDQYQQGDGTFAAAEILAHAGYLTLASDYRNYAGSDPGPNPFRFGYVIDVMNLLGSLSTLPSGWADEERVGMWGHSMGGGITVAAAVLAGDRLDGAVIYGGMSGDMIDNTRHIQAMWQRDEFNIPVQEWGGPEQHPDAYARISPINYLPRARAAMSIHHGTHDEQVPYPWSEKLRDAAMSAGLDVEHYSYPAAPHSFRGGDWELFMQRVLAFYERTLR